MVARSALGERQWLLVSLLVFWLGWFAVARALFLAYQWRLTSTLDGGLVAAAFVHGSRMDVAVASYLTVIPWLLVIVTIRASPQLFARLLGVYLAAAAAFLSLLTVADLEVFAAWRVRLDATPLQFVSSPREMAASTVASPYVRLLLLAAVMTMATVWLLRRVIPRPALALQPPGGRVFATLVLLGGGLFVLIRGGTQWTPLNQSTVFFSGNDFANQAALNPGWTFVHGVLSVSQIPRRNPYHRLDATAASQTLDSLLPPRGASRSVLRTARPNVLIIVWESATAKVISRLGGRHGVTPAFDSLAREGLLFDSVFASGERSAQGLVALLSSYPALPHQQAMNTPHKIDSLPMIGRMLRDAGYQTSFYYGGELEFANIKSYLLASRFDRIVGGDAFARSDRNSKWGAHDHVVLGRQLRDLERESRPFFSVVATLSSHEPFEVPGPPVFIGADEETLFLNAHHYTDQSISAFVRAAQRRPWWDSTLVVIVADHGHVLPLPHAGAPESILDRFHIPMLWLGGALAVRDSVVHTIGSQIDLMPTLLGQLGRSCAGCRWAKDLLRPEEPGFAYFAYRDGFAFIDRAGWTVYDVAADRTVETGGSPDASRRRCGIAMLQTSFGDFLAR